MDNVRKDGTPFFTRGHITRLELGGRPHWVCVQQDVTAQKRAETERAALLQAEREARTHAERVAGYARRLQRVTQLLGQALQNLMSNALKYGHGKPVDVTLEAGADTVTPRVMDRGIGIAPEDQPRLFQEFQRVASERHDSGFGLGLWIVKQVLEAMGGAIQVDSDVGRGAAFTVVLPRRVPAPTP